MKALEDKILSEGTILPGHVLMVGSFLNQQMDSVFIMDIGNEIGRLFRDSNVTKVLTIEASGIAFGLAAGISLKCPSVFAKKHKTANVSGDTYQSSVFSYTHKVTNFIEVSKEFIKEDDNVLIVDDFLANGNALVGLMDIVKQANANLVGCCVAIEKGFQGAGDRLRSEGIRVESLAIIDEMTDDSVIFRKQ